ncbi:alcohol dehydrogenase GroES-like domain-containing protein [Phlyctema vagabunda]|uniref:Alcohol dehydrogenase GroES-like domain-containing protein n=1 Tax=Phlyctema vagabunda TaxID=108571 RepID=A0ABR4P9B4_9HELO
MGSCVSGFKEGHQMQQQPQIHAGVLSTPPDTPPFASNSKRTHSDENLDKTEEEGIVPSREIRCSADESSVNLEVLQQQSVLLLHGVKQRYVYTTNQDIPKLQNENEMLVRVEAIGLNPIDWKAPDFGFGLPALPRISGRDLAGKIVRASAKRSRFQKGDSVIGVSTDYRDSRKSAYQEYAVVPTFNACRIPHHLSFINAAPVGVAFVAGALALGICMGLRFSECGRNPGPDILQTIRSLPRETLPKDVREECFDHLNEDERVQSGEWLVIWGGSSASGCCAVQLAKLVGLKVIAVVDIARSGERMLKYGADLLVDRHDTARAVEIVKSITKGRLRFGFDTRGRESATLLAQAMQNDAQAGTRSHLVGLTGLPKEPTEGVVYHSVPIKVFHEVPTVGDGLMLWLEQLLEKRLIFTPEVQIAEGGLEGINNALDRLRDGTVNGPRIVVIL